MKRREAREILFKLIYETGFEYPLSDESREKREIYELAKTEWEYEDDDYIKDVYFNIWDKLPDIDALIAENAVGWKQERLSRVSQAIMRLCVYEMVYMEDIPYNVAINEAVELAKKYDHDKAPKFINGIVNTIAIKCKLKGDDSKSRAESAAEPEDADEAEAEAAEENPQDDEKPAAGEQDDEKPAGGEPDDEKPAADKPDDEKPAAGKLDDEKPAAGESDDEKPAAGEPDDENPDDEKPDGEK